MAKKITDTASAAVPQAKAMAAPVAAEPLAGNEATGEEPGNETPDPDSPDTGETTPMQPDTGEETESENKTDHADRLLEVCDQYPKLDIDRQGCTNIEDTPVPLRADASLYDNPYHKAQTPIPMALGNVFIKDVDGNIPYQTLSDQERITGLLFDVSLQPELFTAGYGKINEKKLKLNDEVYITSRKSSINDFGIIE